MTSVAVTNAKPTAYDVIVVGGGGAGLAAAAAAAQLGAKVLLLERQQQLGGTTALAVGSITAAGTRRQRRAGIQDAPSDFVEDMAKFTADLLPADNPELRTMLAREAAVTVDWLEDLGAVFVGPYPEPPHRVPRMHNAVPGPRTVLHSLSAALRRQRVEVLLAVDSLELSQDRHGRQTIRFRQAGAAPREAAATGGVILATGDFSGNAELRWQHLPEAAARAQPINPNNHGEGHRLALEAGAVARNMDQVFGPQLRFPRSPRPSLQDRLPTWPWLLRLTAAYLSHAPAWALRPALKSLLVANMSPADTLFAAGVALIDRRGQRLDPHQPAHAVAMTSDNQAFLVFDEQRSRQFWRAPGYVSTAPGIAYADLRDYLGGRPDIAKRHATRSALALALGLNEAAMETALADLDAGPYVVLGPVHAMLTTTEGSVAVDAQCRVLNAQQQPIAGLYAAGCVGQGGLLLRGHGLHWAWTFTSGRVAGQQAARRSRT